jgi:Na+-translocating ferredoxin:NAD+ oxidoreductase subunit B
MSENDIYIQLAKKIKAPTSKRFLAILDHMLTPDEARICLELYLPATVSELVGFLGMDEKKLVPLLDGLIDRGILTRGKTQFAFHTTLLGFHHDLADTGVHAGPHAMSQEIKDLWADFFYNEWSADWVKMAEERKKSGARGNMLTPAIGAIELSPNIKPEQLLPQENWKLQIETAKRRIVAPCGCRTLWGKCDHPRLTCFAVFDNSRGEYFLNKPGRLLKELSQEEVMSIVRKNEELGLIHWGVCYCCTDACEMMYSYTKHNRTDLVQPNRFQAFVNEDACIGCQDCVEKCMFDAIEMRKPAGSKKLKAYIDGEKCRGCGVCVVGCKQKALRLEIVKPPEYITEHPMKFPNDPPEQDPNKPRRKVVVGAYGGYYSLD